MRRGFWNGWPRLALFIAIPIVTFAIAAGLTAGATELKGSTPKTPPVVDVAVKPGPEANPAQPPLVRTDCNVIRGSGEYLSDEERVWYQQNCGANAAAPSATPAPSATATTRPGTTTTATPPPSRSPTSQPTPVASQGAATGAPSSGATGAPATGSSASQAPAPAALDDPATGNQLPTGDRLLIPAIGLTTDVWRANVGANGHMPDPIGYFNVVWYDFSAIPGLGGYTERGNLVLTGFVDCGSCASGGPGVAVLWRARNLQPGDQAQYITADGKVYNYVVTSSQDYNVNGDWSHVVASGAADMTLLVSNGSYDPSARDYSVRHVITFKKT